MKYKIGDRVRVREDLGLMSQYGDWTVVEEMYKLRGKIVTIKEVFSDSYYIEEEDYRWTDEMFIDKHFTKADLQEGDKATLRNGKTAYFKDGSFKYIGCHLNDDLTNNGACGKIYDVMKLERPVYHTIYERQEVKEMTIAEISKALGYEVKIVK